MTVTVMGKKSGCFTDKKTGEVIDYARLYVTAEFEKNTYEDAPVCEGLQCMEVKVPAEMMNVLNGIKVGSKAKLYYNAKGRLEEIAPVA